MKVYGEGKGHGGEKDRTETSVQINGKAIKQTTLNT